MPRWGRKPLRRPFVDALSGLTGEELELLLARHYREQGYVVDHCGTGGRGRHTDGGIDLKLRRDAEYLVVECKHWKTEQVPHNDVHELIGIMHTERATGAIFVTSGEFTDAALRRAKDYPGLQMIDGVGLRRMLGPAVAQPRVHWGDYRLSAPSVPAPPVTATIQQGRRPVRRSSDPTMTIAVAAALAVLGLHQCHRLQPDRQQKVPRTNPSPTANATPSGFAPPAPLQPAPAAKPILTSEPWHDYHQPTPAEIRESKRRADEAMKIIEKTTPEM